MTTESASAASTTVTRTSIVTPTTPVSSLTLRETVTETDSTSSIGVISVTTTSFGNDNTANNASAANPTTTAILSAASPSVAFEPWVLGVIVGGAALALILVGLAVFFLIKRRRARKSPAHSGAGAKISSLTDDTEMASARNPDESMRVAGDQYAEHGDEFRAALPQGSNYFQMPPMDARSKDYDPAAPASLLRTTKEPKDGGVGVATQTNSVRESNNASARVEAWAIDVTDVELGSVLGRGAFGVVRRAEWRGRTVAVKQIKKSTIGDDKAVADFEEEIGRMAAMQSHENVVRLFGVVQLADGDIGAVVEFCAQGALVDALYGEKARDFSPDELLQIAYDAACGVMHLHANKIVHRDIAARNVLLAGKKDLVAKVSDFGMARNAEGVYSGISNEQHTAASIGPVKWMAPEQLDRMAYSRASDVFAFGVLLYEIFARAAPWADVANVNVITQVLKGNRMELSGVPTELRDVVQRCWAQEPRDRPTMQQTVADLKVKM
jgi:hypothetical protein